MAAKDTITTKFKVDISDLKKGISDANKQIQLANSEFKKASAGMTDWAKSSDGIKAKLDQLKSVLQAQNDKLSAYQKQLQTAQKYEKAASDEVTRLKAALEKAKVEYGENSAEVKELEKQLSAAEKAEAAMKTQVANLTITCNNQEAAVKNTAAEMNRLEDELEDVTEAEKIAATSGKSLDDALDEVKDSANDAGGGFTVLKGALANLVADGIRKAITALQDFVGTTIEVGKNFDASMSEVAAISGATGEELQTLRETAQAFGETTKFSASESAEALKYMALAGWDTQQSVDALGGILNLAAASGMDLAKASDMVTDYLSAFGLQAKDSAYFADLLAYAQSNSNTTAEQLGEAYKNTAAVMNAAGQDVETVTSLLAMMANQGLKGSEAGTALTAVMRDMTTKMRDGAIQIGDTSVQVMDANGNYRDMTDILRDVEAATQGMGDAERAAALQSTFTSDSIKGLNLLLNAGVDEAAGFEEALRGSAGSAEEMAAVMQDNLAGDLTNLSSKLEGVQIAIYDKFEPALRSGVEALSGLLDGVSWLVEHSTAVVTALGAMAAGVAAYVAYTTALTVMTNGWMALTAVQKGAAAAQAALNAVMALNPIGIVIAAIIALVAAFVILWNKSEAFRDFWKSVWDKIKSVVTTVVNAIKKVITTVFDAIKKVITDRVNAYKTVITTVWNAIKTVTTTVWNAVKSAVINPLNAIKSTVTSVVNNVKSAISNAWNNVKSTTSSAWNSVKSSITNSINSAKKTVDDVISKIKSTVKNIFNGIKPKLNLSLPKVTVSGGEAPWGIGGKGKLPSFKVTWNRLGGVFDSPTLFGGSRGFQGLGEDGAEAVVPLERNKYWIGKVADEMLKQLKDGTASSAINNLTNNNTNNFTQIINAPKQPSRIELYRQTKNLLNLKGGLA